MTNHRLAGKVVVVTGAGGGQGAAEAKALSEAGAAVWGVDLTDEPSEPLPGVSYRRLDVTDEAGWAALTTEIREQVGRIDGLVANAGITWRARLLEVSVADLDRVHRVNVTGTLLAIQAVAPLMIDGGSIVVVGSVAALTGHSPIAYTASKWALRGLSKAACLELGPRNIRVNAVHPGYIETPMTNSASPAFRQASVAETPLGRVGTVDEIAPLIVFLMGDGSSFISGADIPVDGGMTAHGGVKSISDAMRRPDQAPNR